MAAGAAGVVALVGITAFWRVVRHRPPRSFNAVVAEVGAAAHGMQRPAATTGRNNRLQQPALRGDP
jgi:hypothetical protein